MADVQECIELGKAVTANNFADIREDQKQIVVGAFIELFPELKFAYQLPTGIIEQRINMYLLPWEEIVRRISELPAKQRFGRIRKGF